MFHKLQHNILYLLVILIILNAVHKIYKTQNDPNNAIVPEKFFYLEQTQNCVIKTTRYYFQVSPCKEYQLGTYMQVVGRVDPQIAKDFFSRKRLNVQAVEVIVLAPSSVQFWLQQLMIKSLAIKSLLLKHIIGWLPKNNETLVIGMVFGGSAVLPTATQVDLVTTGLTHVVSASGYNLAVVAAFWSVFSRLTLSKFFSARVQAFLMLMATWSYAIMTLLQPPILRAAIMVSWFVLAKYFFHRQYHFARALVITLIIMLAWEPWFLASLSFWLSALSLVGIILVLPLLTSSNHNLFKNSLLLTLAAQSLALPLLAEVFGQVSWLSLITNTLLLWLTPFITVVGLSWMILGVLLSRWTAIWALVSTLMSYILYLLTWIFLQAVSWFGQFSFGLVTVNLAWWQAVTWWGIIGLIALRWKKRS